MWRVRPRIDLRAARARAAGEGPPVLVVHGMPGGSDQALVDGRFLVDAGVGLIAPSRPGYLGTPLAGREAIDQQGRVLAWSGGGHRLAVRHPRRVAGLVASAAVSQEFTLGAEGLDERLMTNTAAAADHAHRGSGIDNDVPPAHGDHAAATIPGARRVVLDAGTHLASWVHPDAEAAQAAAIATLRGGTASP